MEEHIEDKDMPKVNHIKQLEYSSDALRAPPFEGGRSENCKLLFQPVLKGS